VATSEQQQRRADVRTEGMLIGRDWTGAASDATFEDRDPATGAVLATLPDAQEEDCDRAVRAAREAAPGWASMSGAERGRLMMRLADALDGEKGYIGRLESADNGRPWRETASQANIVARWYRYFGGLADKIEGETIPAEGPYLNYTRRVPVGVCGAITPWNHPLLIASKKVAPALACGNTLVVKPSELAPLSVLELGRLALEVGFPPGVLNVLSGQREAGEAITVHPDVNRIDVTGSTPTGVAVARGAAPTLKRLGFELGGKAANVVFGDANLERAVAGAVFAAYIAQGQSCVAGARVLVERGLAPEFARAMAKRVRAIRVGDPLAGETQMGPLITPAAATRVRGYISGAIDDGAELLAGGVDPIAVRPPLVPEGFCAPTLLWTEDPTIRAAREEIFGPVVTLTPFDTEGQAVEIANSVPFGLGAAVWTRDVSRAHRVADALRAGITWINDYHRIDPASPWGGFGLSGYGRENGWEAVRMFTEVKSVWVPLEEGPMSWYDSSAPERLN
jgi:acyl-CoA reductase-like NAD-dependent aldehyde dehydrogenase